MDAMFKGQEQERKRPEAELHDGIGQILSAMSLEVSQLREYTESAERERVVEELNGLNSKLHVAINEVRNISHDLMPEVLESFGLQEAIKQTCNSMHQRSGIDVKFDHVDVQERYDQALEMNLYRITQELLNNIQKHASSKNVFVSLIDHGSTLNLTVEDDGIGFDLDKEYSGIGLKNITSRVSMMKEIIEVESAVGSGTLINIEIPKEQG